jgi:hypothetical protein
MLKNSLGFLLFSIQNTEAYEAIFSNIDKLLRNNPGSDIIVFSNNSDKINTYNIPILHLNHAKFFDGNLWVFDIMGLVFTKQFTNLNKRILYTNEIPWIKNRNHNYNEWKEMYMNNLDFVTTNDYLYDIYHLCWKKPLDIMENFNHEKIQHIIQSAI